MRLSSALMGYTLPYRVFQAPFAEKKLAPVRAHNDFSKILCVLDVGCGPGTNTHHFKSSSHFGVDINEGYLRAACSRHGRRFVVADVTKMPLQGVRFDFILVNSLFHHLDTEATRHTLLQLKSLLGEHGHIHILDLVLPERRNIAWQLARLDRGDYPRPLGEWEELFAQHFEPVVVEPYPVGAFGVTLWNMVYFKGRTR